MGRNIWFEGISLRCRRVGEFHKSVVMLSREGGIQEAMLHGAYKGKSRLSASTEPFKHLKLLLYHNPVKDSWKITDGELLGSFQGLGDQLYRIYLASRWAEIVEKTRGGGASGEEGEAVFLLFGRALAALSAAPEKSAAAVNVQFLWRFLELMGYQADHRNCGECGAVLDGTGNYDPREHRFLCRRCGLPGGVGPGEGAVRYLLYTLDRTFNEAVKVSLPDPVLQHLEEIPLQFIRGEIDFSLKTPSYRNFL